MLEFLFGPSRERLERAEAIGANVPSGTSPVLPRDVLARLSAGDNQAFADFCDPALDSLFMYTYARTGNKRLAEALVEQICLVAWELRRQIGSHTDFNGYIWLMRIARSVLQREYGWRFRLHPNAVRLDGARELARFAGLGSREQELAVLRLWIGATLEDAALIMDVPRDHAVIVQHTALVGAGLQAA